MKLQRTPWRFAAGSGNIPLARKRSIVLRVAIKASRLVLFCRRILKDQCLPTGLSSLATFILLLRNSIPDTWNIGFLQLFSTRDKFSDVTGNDYRNGTSLWTKPKDTFTVASATVITGEITNNEITSDDTDFPSREHPNVKFQVAGVRRCHDAINVIDYQKNSRRRLQARWENYKATDC